MTASEPAFQPQQIEVQRRFLKPLRLHKPDPEIVSASFDQPL